MTVDEKALRNVKPCVRSALLLLLVLLIIHFTVQLLLRDYHLGVGIEAILTALLAACCLHTAVTWRFRDRPWWSNARQTNTQLVVLFVSFLLIHLRLHEVIILQSTFQTVATIVTTLVACLLWVGNPSPRVMFSSLVALFAGNEAALFVPEVSRGLFLVPMVWRSPGFAIAIGSICVVSWAGAVLLHLLCWKNGVERRTYMFLFVCVGGACVASLCVVRLGWMSYKLHTAAGTPSRNVAVLHTPDETCGFVVTVEPAALDQPLDFLEHVYSSKDRTGTSQVLAAVPDTGDIYESLDAAKTWHRVYKGACELWVGCFTTEAGSHLLWDRRGKKVHRFNQEWKKTDRISTGEYRWLGTWSIGQSGKTIMYAEYAAGQTRPERQSVWQSTDDGRTWNSIFSLRSYGSADPEIRHFHTIQPDPFFPGHWYLSSGDRPEHCRVWLSKDDGANWIEVTDPQPTGSRLQRVHRYTAIQFSKDYLHWGTDDQLQGQGARLVRARRGTPLEVEALAGCGKSNVRTVTKTAKGLVLISQTTTAASPVTINLSPDGVHVFEIASIPNPCAIETSFTYSRGSIAAHDGRFFSRGDDQLLFPHKTRILEWHVLTRQLETLPNKDGRATR